MTPSMLSSSSPLIARDARTPGPANVGFKGNDAFSQRRYLAYPAVLLGTAALLTTALLQGVALESATFFALLGGIAAFFLLEYTAPHDRAWLPNRKEGLRDFFYFGMNGGIDAVSKLGIAVVLVNLGTWRNGLPLWAGLPLGILVADFAGYWLHRWGHNGWLWKVHGVHHTPVKVNVWNNNTIHFINTTYSGLGKTLPLLVLGFSSDAILLAAFVSTLWSFAVHANLPVKPSVLDHFLMSPVHHRLHHSIQLEQAGNFASVTTLWDKLFGTFVYAPNLEPAAVGVEQPLTFPQEHNVLRNQLHPFIDQAQGKN